MEITKVILGKRLPNSSVNKLTVVRILPKKTVVVCQKKTSNALKHHQGVSREQTPTLEESDSPQNPSSSKWLQKFAKSHHLWNGLMVMWDQQLRSPSIFGSDQKTIVDYSNLDQLVLCDNCGEFISLGEAKDHSYKHYLQYRFVCAFCGIRYFSREKLKLHASTSHRKFTCPICNTTVNKKRAKKHLEIHNRPQPEFRCLKCSASFKTDYQLASHQKLHFVVKKTIQYICSFCKWAASDEESLHKHIKASHLKCPECPNYFGKETSLKNHIFKLHPHFKPNVCKSCPERFRFEQQLYEHGVMEHDEPYRYLCHICGLKFFRGAAMNDHLFSHSTVKNFICDVCDKTFRDKMGLQIHTNGHLGVLPYKCEFCPKRFRQTVSRRIHSIKVHTKDYPCQCHYCDKKFIFAKDVKEHIVKNH